MAFRVNERIRKWSHLNNFFFLHQCHRRSARTAGIMQIIQIKESLNIFKERLIILSMPEVHNIQRAQCLIGLFKRKKKEKKEEEA